MSYRKFQEMLGVTGYMDKAGDEGSKSGMTGDDDKGDKTNEDDKGGNDDKGDGNGDDKSKDDSGDKKSGDKKDKSKLSEREAGFLKEAMQRKEQVKNLESELKNSAEELKKFDGIDLEKVNQLLEDAKNAETKKLEDKGEWNKLKSQIVEQHTTEIDGYKIKLEEALKKVDNASKTVDKLTVGHEFDSSSYIADEMTLTSGKARIIYGAHFDIVDGETVAFDKPRGSEGRVQLINGEGNPLNFNDAMKKIVDSDPDRDSIIKSKMKPGSDSKESAGKMKPTVTKLRGLDRIAAGLNSISK